MINKNIVIIEDRRIVMMMIGMKRKKINDHEDVTDRRRILGVEPVDKVLVLEMYRHGKKMNQELGEMMGGDVIGKGGIDYIDEIVGTKTTITSTSNKK